MKTHKMLNHRSISGISVMLIALPLLCFLSSLSASAAPAADTIVLKQKCTAIGGEHTVYINKNNLRIESRNMVILAQSPNWSIAVLNPKKKIYFQGDYKFCLSKIATARTPFLTISDSRLSGWKKSPGENIAGLASDLWFNDHPGKKNVTAVKCWTFSDPQYAAQCAEIMANYYGIPSIGHGLPLRFLFRGTGNSLLPMPQRQFDKDGLGQQDYHWLDTTLMKKMSVPKTMFTIPGGFKKTVDYTNIAVDGDMSAKDAEFILKDLSKHPEALFDTR